MDRDIRKLMQSLDALTSANKKLVSMPANFIRGLVFGIGSAIGATVIAAIAVSIVAKFFEYFKNLFKIV